MILDFIDHTGHIFTMDAYSSKPIGYEYDLTNYIFWLDDFYTNKLSVNNYYIRPVRIVIPTSDIDADNVEVNISVDSKVFSLLDSKVFSPYNQSDKNIKICDDVIKSELTSNDIQGYYVEDYIMIPFYVIGKSTLEGTWVSNVLIHITSKKYECWCPISVGGEFKDESEELIINGRNMGINLPKDIIKAIYLGSFFDKYPNLTLYNEKIKEYLINYMPIKGECGNYKSALASLEWFGWGKILNISALLRTDNNFQNQYIRDYFLINTDIIDSYKFFRNSTLLSLYVKENQETEDIEQFDFSKIHLIGENKPIMENLFDKTLTVHYDESSNVVNFSKDYYDYCFTELGLKLSALAYYYEKYFLPIHLDVFSASIQHQVHVNDIKMISGNARQHINSGVRMLNNNIDDVTFIGDGIHFIYQQYSRIDDNFNCIDGIDQPFFVNDLCIKVPIKFNNHDDNTLFNCVLLLLRDEMCEVIFESHFSFVLNDNINYKYFVINPRFFNKNYDATNWANKHYTINLLCNNKWYTYKFKAMIPEFEIETGKLEYVEANYKQLAEQTSDKIEFNLSMLDPDFINVSCSSYYKNLFTYSDIDEMTGLPKTDKLQELVDKYWENDFICEQPKYLNNVIYADIFDKNNQHISYIKDNELNMYNYFFTDTEFNFMLDIFKDDSIFDAYLMHNNEYWYFVFITKSTISSMHNTLKTYMNKTLVNLSDYTLKNFSLNTKFLINRMKFISSESFTKKNNFEKTDIIACRMISGINTDNISTYTYSRDYVNGYTAAIEYAFINQANYPFDLKELTNIYNIGYNHAIKEINVGLKNGKIFTEVLTLENTDETNLPKIPWRIKINFNDEYNSNNNILFDKEMNPRWKFENYEINANNIKVVNSTTNTAIISIADEYQSYKSGYYKISIRYNIDDYNEHQQIKSVRLFIK